MSESQTERILGHLKAGRSLTALEALDLYGCFRLAARINDLKEEGWRIISTPFKTPGGARLARYSLKLNPTQGFLWE
jgi:hypothetical protein